MKKLVIIFILVVCAFGAVHGQALKRVPKNSRNDSSKADSAVKKDKEGIEKKAVELDKAIAEPRKDEFIDSDGDGVNDRLNVQKTPAVKKQEPTPAPAPKIEKPEMKPSPPAANPPKIAQPEPKETPRKEPAEQKESSSTAKKSKR